MKSGASYSKLSLAECRKILNTDGLFYTDEEIIQIRDWIYHIADIAIDANEMEENKLRLDAASRDYKENK